jgi:predicted SAM-dependent methyltransferase
MEVDKIRHRALQWLPNPPCCGLDLGFGGNAIIPSAICLDLENIYCKPGLSPQHLVGDASDLYWFKDNTMDYIFSSHLLEDFQDIVGVLSEWVRVLKVGGVLLLYLPDEQRYRSIIKRIGGYINPHHFHDNMKLEYISNIISIFFDDLEIIHTYQETDENMWSFFMVMKKRLVAKNYGLPFN